MLYRVTLCTAAALLSCTAANATPIRESAGPVQQVLVASDIAPQNTTASCNVGFVDIPGAFVRITIPSGGNQLLVARFAGHVPVGQSAPGFASASVRIVIGTRELNPVGAPPVSSSSDPFQPPTAIERSGPVAPGAHLVKAQWCVNGDASAVANVISWHFAVEAAPLQ